VKKKRRVLRWVLWGVVVVIVVALGATFAWTQIGVMPAEDAPLAEARADPAITIDDASEGLALPPADGESGLGLVCSAGAERAPWPYVPLRQDGAADGVTVVIARPWLNLAFFDLRGMDAFPSAAGGIDEWAVGGHSLGGVRACQLADDADALILFAAYCATDLSDTDLPVLSLAGTEDGLSTPAKIADARHLLPDDAVMVEIDGASHASFGAYGLQPGDGEPTVSDEDMRRELTDQIIAFAAELEAAG